MIVVIAYVFIFACVFGSYIESGGKIEVILEALPHELVAIFGASLGAFTISNKFLIVKASFKDLGKAIKGPKWKKKDYIDVLSLLFILIKLMRSKGMIAVEPHIENPHESSIFNQFPRVAHDHFAADLICDTLRMLTMGMDNPHQVEDNLEKKLEKFHHEHAAPCGALQNMADGLPAIGIVAAVLGVIKTMGSISEPPEVLGGMIGGALTGTFLGVFLSYCVVGPLSTKLGQCYEEEQQFYFIIRDVIVAHLSGNAPQIAIEIGRGAIPGHLQPTFLEIEEATSNLKAEGAPAA